MSRIEFHLKLEETLILKCNKTEKRPSYQQRWMWLTDCPSLLVELQSQIHVSTALCATEWVSNVKCGTAVKTGRWLCVVHPVSSVTAFVVNCWEWRRSGIWNDWRTGQRTEIGFWSCVQQVYCTLVFTTEPYSMCHWRCSGVSKGFCFKDHLAGAA
jgi:hypothetical protein